MLFLSQNNNNNINVAILRLITQNSQVFFHTFLKINENFSFLTVPKYNSHDKYDQVNTINLNLQILMTRYIEKIIFNYSNSDLQLR